MALAGAWRYQEHRSVPQIHQQLQQRGVCISQRSVSHLLDRYEELVTISLSDTERINTIVKVHKQAILAIDGLQPDMGHEVSVVGDPGMPVWRAAASKNVVVCPPSRFSGPAQRGSFSAPSASCWGNK